MVFSQAFILLLAAYPSIEFNIGDGMRFRLAIQRQSLRNILVVVMLMVLAWSPVVTQGAERSLANVTAAFIYKISKFVIWPAASFKSKQSTVNLCLYGPDKLGLAGVLGQLKGKKTQQRYMKIFSLPTEQALSQLISRGHQCHILYFTNGNLNHILARNPNILASTLLIGASKGFLSDGGMVALILIDNKLNIYINRKALDKSEVKLQARLLMITKTY